MYEHDYVMRLINEIVRTLLKLLFNTDMENPPATQAVDTTEEDILTDLLKLAGDGRINEAENQLYGLTSSKEMKDLRQGLLFYSYLNDMDDRFLMENNYSREEILSGIKDLTDRYGLGSITSTFIDR